MLSHLYSTIERILRVETRLLGEKWLLIILIIGNFIGALIGFQYYIDVIGIADFPPILWILIPDCPMAVLLLVGFYLQGNDQRYLNYNFFTFIQGIRGALITYLIVLNFPSIDIEMVVVGHSIMLLQSILILPHLSKLKINKGTWFIIFLTFFNDFMDFFGLFSIFPPTLAQLPTIQPIFAFFVITIVGSDLLLILLGFSIYFLYQNKQLPDSTPL